MPNIAIALFIYGTRHCYSKMDLLTTVTTVQYFIVSIMETVWNGFLVDDRCNYTRSSAICCNVDRFCTHQRCDSPLTCRVHFRRYRIALCDAIIYICDARWYFVSRNCYTTQGRPLDYTHLEYSSLKSQITTYITITQSMIHWHEMLHSYLLFYLTLLEFCFRIWFK